MSVLSSKTLDLLERADASYELDSSRRICRLTVSRQADIVLEALQPFDGLVSFDTPYKKNDLSHVGIRLLAKAKDLKFVSLNWCDPASVPPESFADVFGLPMLEKFDTDYKGDMDEAMKFISNAKRLRILAPGKSLSDRGLQYVSKVVSLERLEISRTRVTDRGMQYVAQLKNLKELDLENLPISDEGMREIGRLLELRSLSVTGPKITDKGIEAIHNLSNLRLLGVERMLVTDKSLTWIGSLRGLESLFLSETQVSDTGILHLMGKPPLSLVCLKKSRVSAGGARKLEASLPSEDVWVSHESIQPKD
jgi:Leucine-rich repeat (LRR) protein